VKRGDDTASVPDDLTPDELTVEVALQAAGGAARATNRSASSTAYPCSPRTAATARTCSGARPTTLPRGLEKPKMSSLFKTMVFEHHHRDQARQELLRCRAAGRGSGRR
jgi:DNA topoisomerase-1